MEKQKSKVSYIRFLLFTLTETKLKDRDKNLVYYRQYSRDLYYIALAMKARTLLLLSVLLVFPDIVLSVIDMSSIDADKTDIARMSDFLLTYIVYFITISLVVRIIYSLRYRHFEYIRIDDNEEPPDRYVFFISMLNDVYSSILKPASSSQQYKFEFPYRRIFKLLIYSFGFILPYVLSAFFYPFYYFGFFNIVFFFSDPVKNQISLILISKVIALIFSFIAAANYDKAQIVIVKSEGQLAR